MEEKGREAVPVKLAQRSDTGQTGSHTAGKGAQDAGKPQGMTRKEKNSKKGKFTLF